MIRKILFVIVLMFGFNMKGVSATHEGWQVLFCDGCSTNLHYEDLVLQMDFGKVLIINFSSMEIRAYEKSPPRPGLYDEPFAAHAALPPNSQELLDIYADLLRAFEIYHDLPFGSLNEFEGDLYAMPSVPLMSSSSIWNRFGGDCGAEGHWTSILVPEYPFKYACANHDACYSGTLSKESCDRAFLHEMQRIADLYDGSLLMQKVISQLLNRMATVYYTVVYNSSTALEAYCDSTSSGSLECNPHFNPNYGGAYTGRQDVLYGRGSGGFEMTCELWRFPDGMGGYYLMERNCRYY